MVTPILLERLPCFRTLCELEEGKETFSACTKLFQQNGAMHWSEKESQGHSKKC